MAFSDLPITMFSPIVYAIIGPLACRLALDWLLPLGFKALGLS